MSDTITVLLADDHALVRRGFKRLLEDDPELRVVGEASNGDEAVQLAASLTPDVIVMDAAMPGTNGLVATKAIVAARPAAVVLMLSMHSEDTLVQQALAAGARGYILKNAIDLDLAAAVKRVAAGERVIDPALAEAAAAAGRTPPPPDAARAGGAAARVQRPEQPRDRRQARAQHQHGGRAPRQHHERPRRAQDRRAGRLRAAERAGESAVNRRRFLGCAGGGLGAALYG